MNDLVQWTSPPQQWEAAAAIQGTDALRSVLLQPTILRFATDKFMEDFMSILENDPLRLKDFVAVPETWRGPGVNPDPVPPLPGFARSLARLGLAARRRRQLEAGNVTTQIVMADGLKLYQPAHQRYYLVASSLVCGRAGLPDRAVNPGRQERTTFVLRRLLPPGSIDVRTPLPPLELSAWEEYAFVAGAAGHAWLRIPKVNVPTAASLLPGEEQLPLFSVSFAQDDHRRRILAGLIPVGKRESYMGAAANPQPGDPPPAVAPPPPPDPRMMLVWAQFTEPWKRLLETADTARQMQRIRPLALDPPGTSEDAALSGDDLRKSIRAMREQIQTSSWYALLDFAKFLEDHVPRIWQALTNQSLSSPLTTAESNLVAALSSAVLTINLATDPMPAWFAGAGVATSLKAALLSIRGGLPLNPAASAGIESGLESVKGSYNRSNPDPSWPPFLFPLADSFVSPPLSAITVATASGDTEVEILSRKVDRLADLISAALPPEVHAPVPQLSLASQPVMDMREGWFVIRCVFERPECGILDPPVLSEPTRPFQMASFFDPDAPARPIRIGLPIDTSPAGLRKFDKNTAFMISSTLCGQINRMKKMTFGDLIRAVLPWPLHKDLSVPDGGPCTSGGMDAGMICSLSIPIITICALLLLMIIVALLDMVFAWIPFFLICFPLPGFKGKK